MRSNFPNQTKVSRTLRVVLPLDSEVLLVYMPFALLLTHLGARALIPYVQDAIRHSYIVVMVIRMVTNLWRQDSTKLVHTAVDLSRILK